MRQLGRKLSFPLATKLILSTVALILTIIFFLNLSTIILLKKDKRAYTYQSQLNESFLIGDQFISSARQAFDVLRVSIASVNPKKIEPSKILSKTRELLNNQSLLLGVDLLYIRPKGEILRIAQIAQEDALKKRLLDSNFVKIDKKLIESRTEELLKNGYAFINLSTIGKPAVLAVLLADKILTGAIVGVGFLDMSEFGKNLTGTDLTIANTAGDLLYDTDAALLFSKPLLTKDPLFQLARTSKNQNATQEFEYQDETFLGSFVKPGLGLIVLTKAKWKAVMQSTYELTEKYILLGMMAIGIGIIFVLLFAKTLTNPLVELKKATESVSSGNFNLNLQSERSDEFGALTLAFNAMSGKISTLIEGEKAMVALEKEVEVASRVQQTLIPPPQHKDQNIYIESHYESAESCGGDWWGKFEVRGKFVLMIADATGHGIPSALITAAARSCFSLTHKLAVDDPSFPLSPGVLLTYANRVIHESSFGQIMMTFWIGVLDFEKMTLTYASAGHNPMWLFKKEGAGFNMKSLVVHGNRAGETLEVPPYDEKVIEISKDDILFLYTDGIIEGKDLEGNEYGKKKVLKKIKSQLGNGPKAVISDLMEDFLKHNEGKAFDDDVTLVTCQIDAS